MDIVENAIAMELNCARGSNGSWDSFNFSIRALLCGCSGRSTGMALLGHCFPVGTSKLFMNNLLVPAVGDLEQLLVAGVWELQETPSLCWNEGRVCQGEEQLCLTRKA